jgi:hypothetical protein
MKKFLKIVLVIVLLLVVAALGVGFGTDAAFDQRFPETINAPVAKTYALLSDPRRTPEWLPKDAGDITSVEIRNAGGAKAAGLALDAALGGGTNNGKDVITHTYHMKDGTTLDMHTEEAVLDRKYTERIVGGNNQMATMFTSMTWGFEMEPDGPAKTRLYVISKGEAKKPVPNLVNKVMTVMHCGEKNAATMAGTIQAALDKQPATEKK